METDLGSTDIAFSRHYLKTREEGVTIGGLNTQNIVIPPDHTHTFQPSDLINDQDYEIRLCVVQRGVLEVTVGEGEDETKFGIGEGGWWRIRRGERCVVWNKHGLVGAEEVRVGVVGLVERD